MKAQRPQLLFTVIWIVGALLFAFGRPALFGVGASSNNTAPAVVPVAVSHAAASQSSTGSPSGGISTDQLIHTLQVQAATKGDSATFDNLANAYMQKARENGDITYYGLADQALQHSLFLSPNNFDALTTAAWVRLAYHDFSHAAALTRRSLKVNAYHAQTYGILSDAELELGDYSGAIRDDQRMVDLKPGLPSYNRASHIHWLYGDVSGAVRIMNLAIASGGDFPENVAWCEAELGDDYFFMGQPAAAERAYRAALQIFPHDFYALAGLARLYAAEKHYDKAVAYYRQVIAQVPWPQYVIALADTYSAMGETTQARKQYALVDFIFHLFDVNHINIGIDRAQFYADHNLKLAEALRLARAEVKTRHDVRTMDILGWVLYKNHQYRAALAAEQQALRLGTPDSSFYYHLGLIYQGLGDAVHAHAYLSKAYRLNPLFDPHELPMTY